MTGAPRTQDRSQLLVAPTEPVALARQADALADAAGGATLDIARAVAFWAALGWWEAQIRTLGLAPDRLAAAAIPIALAELSPRLRLEAGEFGRGLVALPVPEAVAELGRLYTHALPVSYRAKHGVFYTPTALVGRLLDNAERAGHDWSTGTVIDPSSGGGAFLVEAARRMVAPLEDADSAIVLAAIGARLRGWDIDPFACWLAQLAVEATVLDKVVAAQRRLPVIVECKDALKAFDLSKGRFTLVMGNPAFGKVKKTEDIGRIFNRSLYGHPNLYGMLTDAAVHLAHPNGGIVAYLTPTSYLGGEYFKTLRALLATQAKPVSIDIVESRSDVFPDVLQEVALSCLKRGSVRNQAACSVVQVMRAGLKVADTGVLALSKDPQAPWILPRSRADAPLVARLANMPARLRDWGYRVSTGPLVWNRHRERLHADGGPGRYPVVWAEAVTADGRFSLQASKSNHQDRAWFTPARARDPNLVRRACVLAQRTTAKEQHRRIVCAVIPEQVIAKYGAVAIENHLNMFVPTNSPTRISLKVLAAFLSTAAADRVIRCINGSVALSASELEAMPLPSVDDLMAALSRPNFESAVHLLYGIADEPAAAPAA